jgi:flagellar biosynthetic protein FlhB
MAEQEQNRSEAATPYKIEEAKKKGSVSKSLEVNSLMVILVFLAITYLVGRHMIERQLRFDQSMLSQAHNMNFEADHLMGWLNASLVEAFYMLSPLFILLVVIAILSNVAQTGPVFTFFPLKPDFDRVNPVAGFKRMLSLKLVIESIKSVIKLALFSAVLYFTIKHFMPNLLAFSQMDPHGYVDSVLSQISSLIFKLALVIAFVALLDFMYTRWSYGDQLKMSRREVKEEVKRREGDPRVRARIRELQRETLKRSKALSKVKDADVLITNPVHLAVALKYVRGEMHAPEVIAKGAGELAAMMKKIARTHRIPVVENKLLARALFRRVDFDGPVPEQLFPQVARLLVWAYAIREQQARTAT